jgi:hypothetical protein
METLDDGNWTVIVNKSIDNSGNSVFKVIGNPVLVNNKTGGSTKRKHKSKKTKSIHKKSKTRKIYHKISIVIS